MTSERPQTMPFLKAKIRVGSCKTMTIDYKYNQQVFHKDDIPKVKKERKSEVLEWSRSKLLDDHDPWNKSSKPNNPVVEHRKMENFVRDRSNAYLYNYRAESLDPLKQIEPIDKPTKFHISRTRSEDALRIASTMKLDPIQRRQFRRTEEMPNNENLAGKQEWNSTIVLTTKTQKESLDKMTEKSKKWTSKVNKALDNLCYTNPVELEKTFLQQVRDMKKANTFVPYSIQEHTHPDDKLEALEVRNKNAREPSVVYVTQPHSGVWEYNQIEKRHMWSDTASFAPKSPGDITRTFNPDKYNFAPQLSQRSRSYGVFTHPKQ